MLVCYLPEQFGEKRVVVGDLNHYNRHVTSQSCTLPLLSLKSESCHDANVIVTDFRCVAMAISSVDSSMAYMKDITVLSH